MLKNCLRRTSVKNTTFSRIFQVKCVDTMKKTDSSSPLIKKLMNKIYEQK
jgi:hypothetical protein